MKNRVARTAAEQFCGGRRSFILAVLFCLQFNALYAPAQEAKTISEKPWITQVFDPAVNETSVRVILNSDSFTAKWPKSGIMLGGVQGRIYAPRQIARLQSGLVLDSAGLVYEGRTPTGKQSVRFTFLSKRKDTFKDRSAFSISIEGQPIQEGVAEPPVQLASDQDFRQKIMVSVPLEVFLRIARAEDVQFVLGPKTYKTESFQQKSMQALAEMINPQRE